MVQLSHSFKGHTVEAAKIAAIGNGNPDVIDRTLEAIGELSHRKSLGKIANYAKRLKAFSWGGSLYVTFDIIKKRGYEVKNLEA
jgi:hypothetical protein